MTKQNCYYNKGEEIEFAFVFSVPGKIELYNKRPVSGITGVLLEDLLLILNDKVFENKIDKNSKINRYRYRITNSWTKPIYKDKDNYTEAKTKDISQEENIRRLFNELKDIDKYIFVFGKKAKEAISKINNLRAKIIYERHLGLSSINQIKKDIDGVDILKGESDNTKKRLNVIAKSIIGQIG